MSVKTTYLVIREFALAAILQKLEEAGDEQLSNILEETIHSAFHNFAIVSEEEFQKNKNAPLINAGSYSYYDNSPYLEDLDNLPDFTDNY